MLLNNQFIIAHRGASALVKHENTIEAFQKAIEIGAPIMEFDVRMTKDRIMVSYHDEHIGKEKLSDLTYAQIQKLTSQKGFSVPKVEDILKLAQNKIIMDIELKERGYEEEIIRLVKGYLNDEQYLMTSFLDDVIIKIKKMDSHIKTGLILGMSMPTNMNLRRFSEIFPLYRILKTKPDYIVPNYRLLILGFITRMKLLKLPILVWTVNDGSEMKKLLNKGVNCIITDSPDIGLKVLADFNRKTI